MVVIDDLADADASGCVHLAFVTWFWFAGGCLAAEGFLSRAKERKWTRDEMRRGRRLCVCACVVGIDIKLCRRRALRVL